MKLCRTLTIFLTVMLVCTANTPPRMAWLRAHFPYTWLLQIDENMIEYGHCFTHPQAGLVKSRMTADALRLFDAASGADVAAELDRYRGAKGYARFFQEHTAYDEPFLYEARVRLFRRDFHLDAAIRQRGDAAKLREHATIVYREQQILDAYFSNAVARSSYRLPDDVMPALEPLVEKGKPYRTPVSEQLICAFGEWQLRMALLAGWLAAALGWAYYARKAARINESSP